MLLNQEKYEKLLNESLGLDHYVVLWNLYNNQPISKHSRIGGFVNLLIQKGYVQDGMITEKGIDLIQEDILVPVVIAPTLYTIENKEKFVFGDWVNYLHDKLEQKLIELTGKKQVRDRVKNGPLQSFLCNAKDLEFNLAKVCKKYKLNKEEDRIKIEQTLVKHIENCHKSNSWFPLMYYYVLREGNSRLVTDLDNSDVEEQNFNSETIV
jgi:ASC-1-like (ASCH) protein